MGHSTASCEAAEVERKCGQAFGGWGGVGSPFWWPLGACGLGGSSCTICCCPVAVYVCEGARTIWLDKRLSEMRQLHGAQGCAAPCYYSVCFHCMFDARMCVMLYALRLQPLLRLCRFDLLRQCASFALLLNFAVSRRLQFSRARRR